MKKVLLLIPFYSFFYYPLIETFEKLGYEVKSYDYRRGELGVRIIRFTPFLGKKLADKLLDARIVSLSKKFSPDIILTVKGESISKKLVDSMKTKDNKIVNLFPDPMNLWNLIIKIAPFYDYFFHFDPFVVRKLKKAGVNNAHYLPFAAETFGEEQSKNYDISFIGTFDKFREKNLLYLKEFKLSIWGDHKWYESELKQFARGGRISPKLMHKIIKRSKINLNFHHNSTKEGTNLRTFQVTGCRSFLLTEYAKDLNHLFEINKDIVCFKTPKQLRRLTKYYLKMDYLREKIATMGFKKVNKVHTYKVRLNQMLQIIKKQPMYD